MQRHSRDSPGDGVRLQQALLNAAMPLELYEIAAESVRGVGHLLSCPRSAALCYSGCKPPGAIRGFGR